MIEFPRQAAFRRNGGYSGKITCNVIIGGGSRLRGRWEVSIDYENMFMGEARSRGCIEGEEVG